jgi:CheY-specific phosphatase CheX
MDSRSQDAIDNAVHQSVSGLFEAYGYPVAPAAAPQTSSAAKECSDMAGVIGFCAEQLSGTVVVTTTEEVVLSTLPEGVSSPHSSDWLGELSNQLLGRLKNQLSEFGVVVQVSTPVVLVGPRLRVFGSALDGVRVYKFELAASEARPVTVMVELRAKDDLILERVANQVANALEGTELFF